MDKILILAVLIFNINSVLGQELFGLKGSNEHTVRAKNLNTSTDPDVKKALSRGNFSNSNTHYTVVLFNDLNGVRWILQVFENKLKEGPTFFVPHDSENDSFQVGVRAIKEMGGHLLTLECAEKRLCKQGIDPNRYFRAGNQLFTSTIMRFFEAKNYPVFTLHNNHNSHRDLGGSGAIYADLETPYTGGTGHYYAGDPDDLIIYADRAAMSESYVYQKYAAIFEENKLNNIFEFVKPRSTLGGHMSTYVLLNSNLEYFNIEGQHGHESAQYDYLLKLMSISI